MKSFSIQNEAEINEQIEQDNKLQLLSKSSTAQEKANINTQELMEKKDLSWNLSKKKIDVSWSNSRRKIDIRWYASRKEKKYKEPQNGKKGKEKGQLHTKLDERIKEIQVLIRSMIKKDDIQFPNDDEVEEQQFHEDSEIIDIFRKHKGKKKKATPINLTERGNSYIQEIRKKFKTVDKIMILKNEEGVKEFYRDIKRKVDQDIIRD